MPVFPMLSRAFAVAVNHALEQSGWARERLRRHAGKAVRFVVAPFDATLAVGEDGYVVVPQEGEPALTLRLSPFLLPRLLLEEEAAYREVAAEGDADLAADVAHLFRHLRWDVEEDLSRVLGDVLAHRLVEGGTALAHWPAQAAAGLAAMLAEYAREEEPLLPKREEVARFLADVDTLRDDVERLEKRIERLEGEAGKGSTA